MEQLQHFYLYHRLHSQFYNMAQRFISVQNTNRKYKGSASQIKESSIVGEDEISHKSPSRPFPPNPHQNLFLPSSARSIPILFIQNDQPQIQSQIQPSPMKTSYVGTIEQPNISLPQQKRIKRYSSEDSDDVEESKCPWWIWLIVGPVSILLVGGIIFGIVAWLDKRRREEAESLAEKYEELGQLQETQDKKQDEDQETQMKVDDSSLRLQSFDSSLSNSTLESSAMKSLVKPQTMFVLRRNIVAPAPTVSAAQASGSVEQETKSKKLQSMILDNSSRPILKQNTSVSSNNSKTNIAGQQLNSQKKNNNYKNATLSTNQNKQANILFKNIKQTSTKLPDETFKIKNWIPKKEDGSNKISSIRIFGNRRDREQRANIRSNFYRNKWDEGEDPNQDEPDTQHPNPQQPLSEFRFTTLRQLDDQDHQHTSSKRKIRLLHHLRHYYSSH